jgi:hypothetical protein
MRQQLHTLSGEVYQELHRDSNIDINNNVDFNRMEWDSLHMTFVFAGEILHTLPAESLLAWHAGVCSILEAELESQGCGLPLLRFNGLDLFPPEKKNLVIARFSASPALHSIHREILEFSATLGQPAAQVRSMNRI